MLVMRRLITDQVLMSHIHAAVGSCGKVGWPHHYLTRGLVEGKRRSRGEEGDRCSGHDSPLSKMAPQASFQSSDNLHVCLVYGEGLDSVTGGLLT